MRPVIVRPIFEIANPNKAWVVEQLDKLIKEWRSWLVFCEALGVSSDYDSKTCTEVIMDGWDNIRKHDVLREKTLVFVFNNFSGCEFLFEDWPTPPYEYNCARKKEIAPGWIQRLEKLSACIEYARVPEGFWSQQGKKLVENLREAGTETAVEIAASWLKNPFKG